MPWKESDPVSERLQFLARLNAGERMSELCREFGISRKTGYKIRSRFEADGADALLDRSRRPVSSPNRVAESVAARVIEERRLHPTWGPRKLRVSLLRKHVGVRWPSTTTMGQILKKNGLVVERRRRRLVEPYTQPLRHATRPNAVWCADFKGQFRLGNGHYCYPLTVTDACSRMLLGCTALESTAEDDSIDAFADVFRQWGLPDAIRTDNGVPFASKALHGLSRLSVFWRRLGIAHERIDKGHPEQNGRHERMHRTLKAETTRPPGKTLLQQQERFDRFRDEFNIERPHEALDDDTPGSRHVPSERAYPTHLEDPVYPLHDDVCRVTPSGHIRVPTSAKRPQFYVSIVLGGELLGVREFDDDRWLVSFLDQDLGVINLRSGGFE